MNPIGLCLIVVACLVPLIWLPGIGQGRDFIALFSQYLGMVALIAMSFAQLIATRWPGVESVFGAMDRSYRIHKWLGISAMLAILLHDTIDADMEGIGAETLLGEVAETAGEISLYGLLILVVITVATFIPYHLWKWTHRLIGIFFVMATFHYLFILKPFSNGDPLGIYLMLLCAIGIVAFIYTSAPRNMRPSYPYRINSLDREGQVLSATLIADGRPLRHRAGQFGFFAFSGAGLDEPHPFTISSAPLEDASLRVTIAPLGDLTSRIIDALGENQTVRVEGPHGRFGQNIEGPQIWIAAGVGVTPFLALTEALPEESQQITMIYAVRSANEAVHLEQLNALADKRTDFNLVVWPSQQKGRLSPDDVAEIAGETLAQSHILFCGPAEMRKSFADDFRKIGVAPKRFHYEEFEIRSGIGLRRLGRILWARAVRQI